MRILSCLGFLVALVISSATYADEPVPPGAAPSTATTTDEPDAIGNMVAPSGQSAPTDAQPIANIDSRMNVAAHALEMKEYADAESLLTGVVADVEHATSRYDPALIRPLTMLGDALNGEEKHKEALRSYEQARHIMRVADGLHTPAQVEIVYREANALAAMGKIDKANDRQEYAYETLVRQYGAFGPGLIPGLYHLAAWYDRTSNIFAARGLYERAIQIIGRTHGDADPEMIPALRALAATYKEERFPPYQLPEDRLSAPPPMAGYDALGQPTMIVNRFGPGEAALVEVVKITTADPKAKPLDVALAELDLADWYLLFDKETRAIPVYVHTRQIMRERAGMTEEQIAQYFGQPTPLYRPIPESPPAPPEALRVNPTQGHVELGYTVTEHGDVGDLKTLSSEPEGMMDIKVRRGMKIARFRPRFDGDNPVATPNQVFRATFTYYPHAEGAAANAKPATDDKATGTTQPAG